MVSLILDNPWYCPIMPHDSTDRSLAFYAASCASIEVGRFDLCEVHPRLSVHLLCI
jgi:hypothetical protein